MRALHTIPVIHVTDLDLAMDYYIRVLGFKEDFRLPAYAGLLLDNISIQLSGPANQGMHKPPGTAHCCIDCKEVDTYFDTISRTVRL